MPVAGKSQTRADRRGAKLTSYDGDERDATDDLQKAAPSALVVGDGCEWANEAGTLSETASEHCHGMAEQERAGNI